MEANSSLTGKQPYAAPRLTVYGDLRVLTLSDGGTMGMNDNGGGPDKSGF